jgi:peptidoglycan biosynthesis protein MviN/MurJ (putative lipid II flippase)
MLAMKIRWKYSRKKIILPAILGFSALTGLIREITITNIFIPGRGTDSYYYFLTILVILVNILNSTISANFLPIYSKIFNESNEKANTFAYKTLKTTIVLVFVITSLSVLLLIILFKVNLSYVILPLLLVLSVMTTFLITFNNFHSNFVSTSLNGVVENISFIFILLLLAIGLGNDVENLYIALIIALSSKLFHQLNTARKNNIKKLDVEVNAYINAYKESLLGYFFCVTIIQFSTSVDRVFTKLLSESVITAYFIATKLILIPQTLFTAAIGMILFPKITKILTNNMESQLINIIKKYIVILFGVLAISIFLIVLGSDFLLKKFIFRENINLIDDTKSIMRMQIGYLVGISYQIIPMYIFFAKRELKPIILSFLLGILIFITLCNIFGINTLKIAAYQSISQIAVTIILFFFLIKNCQRNYS